LELSKQIGEEYKNWYERYLCVYIYTHIIVDSFLFNVDDVGRIFVRL